MPHAFAWISYLVLVSIAAQAHTLKINGSTTVNPVVVDAAEKFQKEGWKILVDTQGGSSGGISYLAEARVDLAMSSREVNSRDRVKYPTVNFVGRTIGYDGVALVVSTALYEKGVRVLSREQIRGLYEGKIKNWRLVGGPDQRVVFFNKEPGRGTWEVFAKYLYGKTKLAPKVFHPEVGANQEARTKVANHPGAITQLSASWAWAHPKVKAIAIRTESGVVAPVMKTIENGTYPLRRPLLLYTNGAPKGSAKVFTDFLVSPMGQAMVAKHGYLPLSVGSE